MSIALKGSSIDVAGDDFKNLVEVLVWAWGCGGGSNSDYGHSEDSFARRSKKEDAEKLVDRLLAFLGARGLLIDTVGLGNKLPGALLSVIWKQPEQSETPPTPQPAK